MTKDAISQYSTIAADNTDIGGININTGWSPANVGPAVRELMAQLANVNNQIDAWTGGTFGAISSTGPITTTGSLSAGAITATSLTVNTGAIVTNSPTGNITAGGVVSGTKLSSSGGVVATGYDSGGAHFRMQGASYGAFWRNDNSQTSLLLTNSGSPSGSFNSLRPFTVTNSSGLINIDGTGAGVVFGGAITVNGALSGANAFFSGKVTVQAGASGTDAVNWAQFASSTSSGEKTIPLPDGTKMKAGSKVVTLNGSGQGTVTFSSAFASAPITVVAVNGDSVANNGNPQVGALAASGFNFSVPGLAGVNYRINYWAVA